MNHIAPGENGTSISGTKQIMLSCISASNSVHCSNECQSWAIMTKEKAVHCSNEFKVRQ